MGAESKKRLKKSILVRSSSLLLKYRLDSAVADLLIIKKVINVSSNTIEFIKNIENPDKFDIDKRIRI